MLYSEKLANDPKLLYELKRALNTRVKSLGFALVILPLYFYSIYSSSAGKKKPYSLNAKSCNK